MNEENELILNQSLIYEEDSDEYLYKIIISNTENYKAFMDHIEISKSLLSENIRMMSNKSTLNKMIYSNIITAMEAYLSDTFIGITMNDPGLIRRFIETSADFKKEKVEIQKVFEWIEDSANMVKSKLMDTTFHNIIKVKENYKNVLDVDFINEGALINIIN